MFIGQTDWKETPEMEGSRHLLYSWQLNFLLYLYFRDGKMDFFG